MDLGYELPKLTEQGEKRTRGKGFTKKEADTEWTKVMKRIGETKKTKMTKKEADEKWTKDFKKAEKAGRHVRDLSPLVQVNFLENYATWLARSIPKSKKYPNEITKNDETWRDF